MPLLASAFFASGVKNVPLPTVICRSSLSNNGLICSSVTSSCLTSGVAAVILFRCKVFKFGILAIPANICGSTVASVRFMVFSVVLFLKLSKLPVPQFKLARRKFKDSKFFTLERGSKELAVTWVLQPKSNTFASSNTLLATRALIVSSVALASAIGNFTCTGAGFNLPL